MADSEQQENMLKTAAGVAGGALLLSPVGMPFLHGLAGVAVASLGVVAAGSAIGAIKDNIDTMFEHKDEEEDIEDRLDDLMDYDEDDD